jgi:hypothetical protein
METKWSQGFIKNIDILTLMLKRRFGLLVVVWLYEFSSLFYPGFAGERRNQQILDG